MSARPPPAVTGTGGAVVRLIHAMTSGRATLSSAPWKAKVKQRSKEAWFNSGTAAFERVFPGARAKAFPELENPYVCPLCRGPFPRSGLTDGTLTFEDAPPKSYGGKPVALTCKPCNNSFGSAVDSSLARFDSQSASPCTIAIDGVQVNAYQEVRPGGRHFSIPENQNHPAATARFNEVLDTKDPATWTSLALTLKWDEAKRRRADVAWLKSAYMVAFATWGYMYAFAPGLRIVLRQLERYDEAIIPHFKLRNVAAARKSRELLYVRRPRELEGVAVWIGQHIVLLPPDGRDMTFYERVAPILGRAQNITLQGDQYYWPTEPKHTLDVQAYDSPLLLPTRADVHILT